MSQDLGPLFVKGISKHYFLEYDAIPSVYERIFHVDSITGRYDDEQLWELYGAPARRNPLEPIKQDTIKQNYRKRYTPVSYGLGDTIAWEDWTDDQYGVLHRALPAKGGALARSFKVLCERTAANLFTNLGFVSGTSVAGSPDGVSLFNTAHPISQANSTVTYANRPSSDIDLSISAAQAARANLVQQFAPNNYEIIDNKPRICVVNPNLHQVATQVFKGPWERGTADRNMNTLPDDNVEVVEWPYFRSSGTVGAGIGAGAFNSWFIVGDTHYLRFINRTAFDMKSDFEVGVLAYIFVAFMRFVTGWTDSRGCYGSLGL